MFGLKCFIHSKIKIYVSFPLSLILFHPIFSLFYSGQHKRTINPLMKQNIKLLHKEYFRTSHFSLIFL